MKNTRKIISALLIVALLAVSLSGCYIVSGQKMRNVKGTYKLTTYTYTPQHERKSNYTALSHDYVNDERYKYEDYLIVTGTGTGYYVHTEAGGDNYIKEITLSYEYDSEDTSKVNYVIYNDSLSVNSDEGGRHRLGVSKDGFNYYKAAFDYTELFTKREMRTESLSVHWEKVSRAADLSYVNELFGNLPYYEYSAFSYRGLYEITNVYATSSSSDYLYFFCKLDTAKDSLRATLYYQKKDSEKVVAAVEVVRSADGWDTLTVDGVTWDYDVFSGNYEATYDGTLYSMNNVGWNLNIDDLIGTRLAIEAE